MGCTACLCGFMFMRELVHAFMALCVSACEGTSADVPTWKSQAPVSPPETYTSVLAGLPQPHIPISHHILW
jgi:hypothetical protein